MDLVKSELKHVSNIEIDRMDAIISEIKSRKSKRRSWSLISAYKYL